MGVRKLGWLVLFATWITTAACLGPPVATVHNNVVQQTPIRVPQNEKNQVDILFLVDNSPSMDQMQTELKQKFSQFFTVFQDLAQKGTYADLNIGVITSDYGAGQVDNPSITNGVVTGCYMTPGGQKGLLQRTAAQNQPNTGCAGPVGQPFIHYAFGSGAPTSNLPAGAALSDTFTCMASVGSNGCGFEHQLEAVYAALHAPENSGFVRDGALLTVVFVTNEDDGSAPHSSHIYDPATSEYGTYGYYDTYRQTRFGVACGNPLALTPYGVSGPLDGCVAAENDDKVQLGQEYDVSRYISLLLSPTAQMGIKDDPTNNVILVGIDAPETPFEIIEADPRTGAGVAPYPSPAAYQPCMAGAMPGTQACVYRLQHSCQNQVAPGFFGDPAVRLNTVINKARFKQITSICGDDPTVLPDYSTALQEVATLISSAISPGCIPAPLTNPNAPDCVVEDVSSDSNGNITGEKELPECALDATTKLPLPNDTFPCWAVQAKDLCKGLSPEGVGVTIFRNGMDAPPNTNARVECSTIAGLPM